MIRVENLEVRLSRKVILCGMTFAADTGVTGIVGVNGAGKTTLFRAIAGAIPIRNGTITPVPGSGRVGYAPQLVPTTGSFTCLQYLMYLAALDGMPVRAARARAAEVLPLVDLTEHAGQKTNRLSGGMRKRLGIAQALLADPPVLLLDEPTSGLDPIQRRHLLDLITGLSSTRTILLSTHSLADIVDAATRFVLVSDGRVVQTGSTSDLDHAGRGEDALESLLLERGRSC